MILLKTRVPTTTHPIVINTRASTVIAVGVFLYTSEDLDSLAVVQPKLFYFILGSCVIQVWFWSWPSAREIVFLVYEDDFYGI